MLTAARIREMVSSGGLFVNPFDDALVNPISLDVRLGPHLKVYDLDACPDRCLDFAADNPTRDIVIPPSGVVLQPNVLYIGSTVERFEFNSVFGQLGGKSSVGRLGLAPHYCAGFIDVGFRGQITLELVAVHPVRVYPGMRIAQLVLAVPDGPISPYWGKYQDQSGPTPSRSWVDHGTASP